MGDASRVRYWAAAPADLAAALDAAKDAGVVRFICGFLPDEVDWPMFGGDWRQAYWCTRTVFRPFLLPALPAPQSSGGVLCICDDADRTGKSERDLAHAIAATYASSLTELDVSGVTAGELASAIATAETVVNAVRDWSLGFAIDEFAARVGRFVVRVRQPGYSPLRYALLDQPLIASGADTIPALRPLLGGRREVRPAAAAASWFGDAGASARWARLTTWKSFQDFWTPVHWSRMQPGPFDRGGSWLNRPVAWAMLDAARTSREFPPAAAERAIATMTSWLVAEQRAENGGTARGWGLSRWVLYHPEWIETYRKARGEGREAKNAVCGWIQRGLEIPPPRSRIFPALRAASWAIGKDELGGQWPASLVLAWRDAWDRVPAILASHHEIAPAVQEACAGACWMGLAESRSIDRSVLDDDSVWTRSFGGAAPVLRALAAARFRRWSLAVSAWRAARALVGIPARFSGVARVLRIVYADAEAALPVLAACARGDATKLRTFIFDFVAEWNVRRKWELWRRSRPSRVERELTTALILLRCYTADRDGVSATAWRLQALLAGFAGETEDAHACLSELARLDPRAAEGACSVAIALWLGEHENEALALVAGCPAQSGERPVLLMLRAVLWQLGGKEAESTVAVARLRDAVPDYFADPSVADVRWACLGVVYKDAGRTAAVARVRAIAAAVTPGAERLIDDVPDCGRPLPSGWMELLPA